MLLGVTLPGLSPHDAKRAREQMNRSLRAEGAAAFWAGFPVTYCPDFVMDDMGCMWRQGWRNARDEANKRRSGHAD